MAIARTSRWKRQRVLTILAGMACLGAPAAASAQESPFLARPERVPIDGAAISDVVVLDYDGDGFSDIAAVGSQRLELVRGLPDGWEDAQSVSIPAITDYGNTRIAADDVTGDGRDDIVVGIADAGSVAIVRGRADGVLAAPAAADIYALRPPEGSYIPRPSVSLTTGDVDQNGSPDIVAGFQSVMLGQSSIEVLVNDGHGVFSSGGSLPQPTPPQDVLLTRLGGDADLDLVVAHGGTMSPTPTALVEVRAGAAGATFGSPTTYDAGSGAAMHLAGGDFDRNGAADVVVGRLTPSGGYNPPPAVLPGGVSGPTLGGPVPIGAAPFDVGAAVEAADVNRDGRDDVVVDSANLNGLVSLLGTGTLAFTARGGAYIFPRQFAAWTLGDADDDGKLDLVTLLGYGAESELDIYYGRGPVLRPSATVVDFGAVAVGSTSAALTGGVTNQGPGTAERLALLADGDAADFELAGGDCIAATLPVGAGCTVSARFRPTAPGERELDVALVAPDSDEAIWVALAGVGTNPAPAPTPTATPPKPPAPGPAAPVLVSKGRPRVTGNGRLDTGWTATCPPGTTSCQVSALVVERRRPGKRAAVLVRASVTVAAGASRRLIVKLTPAGLRALRRSKSLRATVKLTATRPGTRTLTVQRTVTLRRATGP